MVVNSSRHTHNAGVSLPPDAKDGDLPALASPRPTPADDGPVIYESAGARDAGSQRNAVVSREFEFSGTLLSVAESREQIMQFVEQCCADEGDLIDILVAVQEALANAALHGCGDDPAKKIHCSGAANASDITITVRDPGRGFDLGLADPDKYAATTLSHGRGISLIRSLMTEVTFARGGSEMKMRKCISLKFWA